MLERLPEAIGQALRHRRAGLEKLAFNRIDLRQGMGAITLGSMAFVDHGPIPASYTADGPGLSPPLHWAGVPADATSLVLMVEDADAPTAEPLVHAIVVGMLAQDGSLGEAGINVILDLPDGPRRGRNSYLMADWLAPDPPPGHGLHRYAFQLFALGPHGPVSQTPGREEVLALLTESALASGMLVGTYERSDGSVKEPFAEFDAAPLSLRLPTAA